MNLPKNKSMLLPELTGANPYLLLGEGIDNWHIDTKTDYLTLGHFRAHSLDSPWVHVKGCGQPCKELWTIGLQCGFVLSPCLDCYKTVVRPQTVEQLINLLELMEELQYPSKCGLEERDYVFGFYGGYFYSRGLDAMKAREEEVRPLVRDRVGDIPVYSKRFCTEFEARYCPGGAFEYRQPDGVQERERRLLKRINWDNAYLNQPDDLKELLIIRWLKKASSIGDATALKFNGNMPFGPKIQIYKKGMA